jgi:hypothetical protein
VKRSLLTVLVLFARMVILHNAIMGVGQIIPRIPGRANDYGLFFSKDEEEE